MVAPKKSTKKTTIQQKLRDAATAFGMARDELTQELYSTIVPSQKTISKEKAMSRHIIDTRIKVQAEAIMGILEAQKRDGMLWLEAISDAMSEELQGPFDFNTLLNHIYQESKYIGKLSFVRYNLSPVEGEPHSKADDEMLAYMETILFDYYKLEEQEKAYYDVNKMYMAEDGKFFATANRMHQETEDQLAKIISFLYDFTRDSENRPIFDMVDIYMDLQFLRAQIHHAVKNIIIVE